MHATTIRVPLDWMLIARDQNINISEVCRIAIATAIGIDHFDDAEINRERKENVEKRIREKWAQRKREIEEIDRIEKEEQEQQFKSEMEKQQREEMLNQMLIELFGDSGSRFKKRLPENDRIGDYAMWWKDQAQILSEKVGFEVKPIQIQQYLREMMPS